MGDFHPSGDHLQVSTIIGTLPLADRMHERLEIVRPYLQAAPETPNTRWNEIVGMLGDGRSADEVLKLRRAMSEICVIYLEYLVELRHQVETVRRDVTNTVEGAPSPDEDREGRPDRHQHISLEGEGNDTRAKAFWVGEILVEAPSHELWRTNGAACRHG